MDVSPFLVRYMTRCPFSLSRLVKVTATGQVIYKAEKHSCRAFPDLHGDGIVCGPKRNFQIFWPLDFLAEFTQHIPPTGSHLIRSYGWYSSKTRGLRKKAAGGERAEAPPDEQGLLHDPDSCSSHSQTGSPDQPPELSDVDRETFLASF